MSTVSLRQSNPSAVGIGDKLEYEVSVAPLPPEAQFFNRIEIDPSRDTNASTAGFVMSMQRKPGTFVFTYYIPSGLLVISTHTRAKFSQVYPKHADTWFSSFPRLK